MRLASYQALVYPSRQQCVFDARRADDERAKPRRAPPELTRRRGAACRDRRRREAVCPSVAAKRSTRSATSGDRSWTRSISPERKIRLARKVRQQVGLMHRRHRMPAHHRVPVDAIRFAAIGGEEISECGVALELWRTDDNRHRALLKYSPANFNGTADIAYCSAGIECRADLVVADGRRASEAG